MKRKIKRQLPKFLANRCPDKLEFVEILPAIFFFRCIDNAICFKQNLPIQAIHPLICVMMADNKGHSFNLRFCQTCIRKESRNQCGTFFFLQFSIGIAIFYTAHWTGNIVGNRFYLKKKLRFWIELFQFTNRFSIRPHLHEVFNIADISA